MFYMGGMTFGYLQPPRQATESTQEAESETSGSVPLCVAEMPRKAPKSAESPRFLWVRPWLM